MSLIKTQVCEIWWLSIADDFSLNFILLKVCYYYNFVAVVVHCWEQSLILFRHVYVVRKSAS